MKQIPPWVRCYWFYILAASYVAGMLWQSAVDRARDPSKFKTGNYYRARKAVK